MQVKGYIPVPAGLALATAITFSNNQINKIPDVLVLENNTFVESQEQYLGGRSSTASTITVHFDSDAAGTGSFSNDAISPVVVTPGSQQIVNVDAIAIDKAVGGQLRLRTIAASFPGVLRATSLYRYNGVQ